MLVRKLLLVIFITIISVKAIAAEKLIFALDIFRHGDRTPLTNIPKAPHKWLGEPGELTALGMQQEYQLGIKMRKRYIEHSHLLPAHFDNNTLYVYSTNTNRTLMSAQSLLLGLYPLGTGPKISEKHFALPSGFQPIPIHTERFNQELWLFADSDETYFKKLLDKYVVIHPAWQAKLKELSPMFSHWSHLTGVSLHDLYDVENLSDALYIYKLHHVPYPKGLTDKEADKIIQEGQWAFLYEWNKKMGRVTGHQLMMTIANYFDQVIHQHSPLKLVLISGHDSTILSAMSAMQDSIKDSPPVYASDLNFALYEIKPHEYVVRIHYNDKPVHLSCGYHCPLKDFLQLIS